MQFGRVPPDELIQIDYTLPEDSPMTGEVLESACSGAEFKAYVGCTKWMVKEWVGNLYPPGAMESDYLNCYTSELNTIEFGPTFYGSYTADQIKSQWADKVSGGDDFKFCPRFPTNITHIRRFKNADIQTKAFFDGIAGFGNHLGPILIQLPENFTPQQFDDLQAYLRQLPSDIPMFVEGRNKDWFVAGQSRNKLFGLLKELRLGAAISDVPGRRDVVHMQLTTPSAMIRFVGNNAHPTDRQRLDAWVERIGQWRDQGLQSLYFFMHQHDEHFAPPACVYLIEKLNKKLSMNIKVPSLNNP